MAETFLEEMKRYLGFTGEDCARLREMGPSMEKHLPEMAEIFYSQIPHHPNAHRVFVGGQPQIDRLKRTLIQWGRGLFTGAYDEGYADERFRIGYRHVRIGLEQKYMISAMGVVRAFLMDCLTREYPPQDERMQNARSLSKMLDLDLNLMCESYMHATMDNLRALTGQLERANEELAEASRAKDEFLAQTSHELRTPLNSILGFTKLILDGLCKSRDEERELMRDIFASGQHLLGIVNDILDIGRIEAGRMQLRIETVNLRQVLDSTFPLVAVQMAAKSLVLRDETQDHDLPPVSADEVRLRQVLLNLLGNALKFTEKGSIAIRAVPAKGRFLRLEVEDTGIGIPEEKREAAFQRFVQLDTARGRRQGGSGLGLAITRRLVEMMGGEIGLEDTPGGGTRVWFTLPVAGKEPYPRSVRERTTA